MNLYKQLIVLAFLLVPAVARSQVEGLPAVDFQRYFPHLIAVSEVQKNAEFPDGVQYKFITVRDEKDKVVIVALIRREGADRVSRLLLAKGPIDNSERILKSTVASYSEKVQMKFEFFDLSGVRNLDVFMEKAATLGWEWKKLPSN